MEAASTAIGGRAYQGNVPVEPKPADRTQLERLTGGLGRSERRFRDMLDAFESRLDRVELTPTAIGNAERASPAPEPPPGSMAAVDMIDTKMSGNCDRLDALLVRLGKLI